MNPETNLHRQITSQAMGSAHYSLPGIRENVGKVYKDISNAITCADADSSAKSGLQNTLHTLETAVIHLRNFVELQTPPAQQRLAGLRNAPVRQCAGRLEVNEYGWLHISLNTLLPHCHYRTPQYLIDTLTRLIQEYREGGGILPLFQSAFLIIDEHCDLDTRMIYDQDNRGWKALPNVLKGVAFADDDQFSLQLCLLSTRDKSVSCEITILGAEDIADFFSLRMGGFGTFL